MKIEERARGKRKREEKEREKRKKIYTNTSMDNNGVS